jgi:hypothetical protein
MVPPTDRRFRLTRRELLAAGAGLLVASACGGSGDDDAGTEGSGGTGTGGATDDTAAGAVLLKFFDANRLPAGREVRMPFGIGDVDGTPRSEGPAELEATITTEAGDPVASVIAARHGEGIPRVYYPVVATLPDAGIYRMRTVIDGEAVESAVQAVPAQQAHPTPGPGDAMVPLTTPTTADARGVDPICTRKPPCPLHDVSVDTALQTGKPIAFLIATPAFCEVRICGPVVDVLTAELDAYGDRVTMIHAEVYTDLEAQETTEAVNGYRIASEPVLFLAGADGVIRRRLDVIFDGAELRAGIESVLT